MCETVIWLGSFFDAMGEMDVWEGRGGEGRVCVEEAGEGEDEV